MQTAEKLDSTEAGQESDSDTSGPQSLNLDDVSQLFRLFEMDILCGGNSAYYRVITSTHAEKILNLGIPGLGLAVVYLFEAFENNETNADPMVLEAWCILISFFAEKLEAKDAPQDSDLINDWFMWAADFVGIQFSNESEDDNENDDDVIADSEDGSEVDDDEVDSEDDDEDED